MDWNTILQSASIIIAAIAVIVGVNAWKREFVGRRRIELAEEVLALFYEAEDVVHYMRSPMGYTGEGSSREASPDETPEEKKISDQAYVVFERYNNNKEVFHKIKSQRYSFMARFGKDKEAPFEKLDKVISSILAAASTLKELWLLRKDGEQLKDDVMSTMKKCEAIFWEGRKENDPIVPQIKEAVSAMETYCNEIVEHYM